MKGKKCNNNYSGLLKGELVRTFNTMVVLFMYSYVFLKYGKKQLQI